jgi:Skp family chaperone for outer membrane proteins
MTSRKLVAATTGAAAALIFASTAFAQTAPAAAPQVTHGPVLAGICYMSTQEALATSTVGRHVNTRMQQLITQVQSELQPEQAVVQNEAKTLQSAAASLDAATRQQRGAAWQQRADALNNKAALRQRELEATQQKAVARVLQEMDPIAKQLYQQRRCSILLDRDSVMLGNPQMDLTSAVVTGLNGRIQTFAFERERIAQQAPAAGN